jgi:predicted HicB family RNase H-like nuclease
LKIQNLLEGIIRVPDSVINDIMGVVATHIFSNIVSYLSNASDEEYENIYEFKRLASQYRKHHLNFNIYDDYEPSVRTSGKVYVRMSEVDKRYLKRNKNAASQTYTLNVIVGTAKTEDTTSGGYMKKRPSVAASMYIETPSYQDIIKVAKNPEYLSGLMREMYGVVHHEAQHTIQDFAFKSLPDEMGYYDADGTHNKLKYYTDDLEFSPLIRTAASDFERYLTTAQRRGIQITPDLKKQMIAAFVNPDAPTPAGIKEKYSSEFFEFLFKHDRTKWKKAVKYFYGLL